MTYDTLSDRQLDAMFAERVLGHDPDNDPWPDHWLEYPHDEETSRVPEFTRSLDAAWQGVEKLEGQFSLGKSNESYVAVHTSKPPYQMCDAVVPLDKGPARAVVIACLKAVE